MYMYCAKCDKTIKKERLESVRRELMERYGHDPLAQGLCPVCGTQLVDLDKRGKKDAH